ncbi:MAG TPA: glycosyltransferase [Ktedonobacterales bacterium]|nr:glycosyltransferase [Ktedonobacterales bacterium]
MGQYKAPPKTHRTDSQRAPQGSAALLDDADDRRMFHARAEPNPLSATPMVRFLRRAAAFGMVGGFVAALGLAVQYGLVQYIGLDKHLAYFIQSIVSIETNFFINNFVTWGDRRGRGFFGVLRTWSKFHFVRIFTVALNQILYAVLLFLGVQYLLANVLCILIILIINYWSGDKFIFSVIRDTLPPDVGPQQLETALMPRMMGKWLPRRAIATQWPSVSVVIPVKRSEAVIEGTIASLLQQEYPGPVEIVLVGDKNDSTWGAIRPYIDAGMLTIIEAEIYNARQDMNAKRNIGLRQARGQVLTLIDSDMILPSNWMASGVEQIRRGWPCVVGSVKNTQDSLLAAFASERTFSGAAATPTTEHVVDVERVGVPEYKLPITSNVFISRDVLYYIQFPDPDFDTGYENYQWHWELARADVAVLSAPAIRAAQRRRLTWRQALDGYVNAGRGCANFILKYPQAPFSRRRIGQLALGTLLSGAFAAVIVLGALYPDWPTTLGAPAPRVLAPWAAIHLGWLLIAIVVLSSVITLVAMGIASALRYRQARGILFPALTLIQGVAFAGGLFSGLTNRAPQRRGVQDWRVRFTILNTVRQSITTPTGETPVGAWSVSGPQVTGRLPAVVRESLAPAWPTVSVIIPVKRSQATIRSAVQSLLNQDYRGKIEILLVGDVDDPTWEPIWREIAEGRVSIIETEVHSANRDSNAKRTIGLRAAQGEILALTDSDMVLPGNWVSLGINYILKGWPCVAGPMRGARGDFWDSYADLVDLGSKTPRFGANVIVDRARFGQPYHKPPITANVFFTREVLAKSGDFDPSFTHSYEDYSWFWEVCRAGLPIFCTPELMADHYHRQGWRQLVRQYTRAGRGCGDFVLKYPDSPLSQGRLMQLAGVWATLLMVASVLLVGVAAIIRPSILAQTPLATLGALVHAPTPLGLLLILAVGALGALTLLALGVRNAFIVRRPIAVIYPFITSVFAIAFSVGLTDILLGAFVRWLNANRATVATGIGFAGILVGALGIRLWDITTKPGVEWDEPVYANVAWNLAHHGKLMLKPEVGQHGGLYFSQPPFYFALLAGWYWLTGANSAEMITRARLLAALMSVVMLAFLFLFLRRSQGAWALIPTLVVAVDGWIVYSDRISWIDNTALPLGIAGLWAYDRAMQQDKRRPFVLAGVLLASAALFKYLAIYFCLAIIINWLLTRKQSRGHIVALLTIGGFLGVYLVAGIGAFAFSSSNQFLLQHLHQILRTTDKVSSRGNVASLQQVITALVNQYKVFTLTVVLCAAGAIVLCVDMLRCVTRRSLAPLRRHSLEASWTLAAFILFGAVQIKFINYFAYVMIPLLVYLCVRVVDVVKPWVAPTARRKTIVRIGLAALLLVVVGLDLVSFDQRIVTRDDNTFLSVQAYAAVHIPAHDQVLTEQPIGTMIRQPYCQLTNITNCAHPRWIILFLSLTEQPPTSAQLHRLLAISKLRETYIGFKETVYIYQIALPHKTPVKSTTTPKTPTTTPTPTSAATTTPTMTPATTTTTSTATTLRRASWADRDWLAALPDPMSRRLLL